MLASKRTTQVAETILSPQKAFQLGEELDGICRAGICKGGSPGEVRLSLAMGLATWVQGTIKRLCSRELGWFQRQTRQQRGACNKEKSLPKLSRSSFQGSIVSLLAFLEVLGIFNRLWQKNDRYWVYSLTLLYNI